MSVKKVVIFSSFYFEYVHISTATYNQEKLV